MFIQRPEIFIDFPKRGNGPVRADDARWRMFTRLGNEAFDSHDFDRAREAYAIALGEADRLFTLAAADRIGDGGLCHADVVPLYIVSYLNCADLFDVQARHEDAANMLQALFCLISETMENPGAPLELREACGRSLQQVMEALVRHLKMRGDPDGLIGHYLERAQKLVFTASMHSGGKA